RRSPLVISVTGIDPAVAVPDDASVLIDGIIIRIAVAPPDCHNAGSNRPAPTPTRAIRPANPRPAVCITAASPSITSATVTVANARIASSAPTITDAT